METFVDHAARVLAYLHTHAQVEFRLVELTEFYHPIAPGSKPFGRLVMCVPFPAETWVPGGIRYGCPRFTTVCLTHSRDTIRPWVGVMVLRWDILVLYVTWTGPWPHGGSGLIGQR